jgi:hypothetical protein
MLACFTGREWLSVRLVCGSCGWSSAARRRSLRATRAGLRITESGGGKSGPDERSPTMELLIIVLALCLLGSLAIMFGTDSRGGIRSREEEAAGYGMAWDAGVRR